MKSREVKLGCHSPGEMKSREVELGSDSRGETKSREVELGSDSRGETKSREVELGTHSWTDCLAAEFFNNSCFSDTVFATLLRLSFPQQLLFGHCLRDVCSAQLLKQQLAECTSCLALAGSPPP